MSFGGWQALIMIGLFIVLLLGVTKLDLPGWILPAGLILGGMVVRGIRIRRTN